MEGIINALNESGIKEITVAEGSGTGDTADNFGRLGYAKPGADLLDLDKEKTIVLPVSNYNAWNEITVPEFLLDKFGCELLGRTWQSIRYLRLIERDKKRGSSA